MQAVLANVAELRGVSGWYQGEALGTHRIEYVLGHCLKSPIAARRAAGDRHTMAVLERALILNEVQDTPRLPEADTHRIEGAR